MCEALLMNALLNYILWTSRRKHFSTIQHWDVAFSLQKVAFRRPRGRRQVPLLDPVGFDYCSSAAVVAVRTKDS